MTRRDAMPTTTGRWSERTGAMSPARARRVCTVVAAVLAAVHGACGGEQTGLNVARGRPYTLTPAPSYAPCTEPGDARQLTDGQTAGAQWLRQSTVGWSYPKVQPQVVIDLGCVEPVAEVRVYSIGGGKAGVFYPASILVLVSDDGRTFHVAGAASNVGLPQQRFEAPSAPATSHVFRISDLATRGRFVLIVLETDGAYVFADEIEVLRGEHDPGRVGFDAANCFAQADIPDLLPRLHERAELILVRQWLEAQLAAGGDAELSAAFDRLVEECRRPASLYDPALIRRLTEELYALRGRLLRRRHDDPLGWCVANPMEQVRPTETIPDDARRLLTLRCWRGEYESAAITLVNQSTSALRLTASVSSWRRSGAASSGDRGTEPAGGGGSARAFTLRHAVTVHSRSLGPVGDALVRLPEGGWRLPAGRAGQLWLTFHDPQVPAGEYEFDVRVAVTDEAAPSLAMPEIAIPGRLTVDPIAFPPQPTLMSCTWSYVRRARATASNADEAVADLRAHYTNVFVLHPREIPAPQRGADGRLRVDFNAHAAALRLYAGSELAGRGDEPEARVPGAGSGSAAGASPPDVAGAAPGSQLLFLWGLSAARPDFPGMPPRFGPEWKALMTAWLRQWVAFLRQQGIGYDRFAMYPFDEYIGDAFYELARFIKQEVDPQIRIYANARGDPGGREMLRLLPLVDVWCLPDQPAGFRPPAHEQGLREGGARAGGAPQRQVWTYACAGPGKALPPYAYYRLQMWRAFARGDSGCGFWLYSSRERSPAAVWRDLPVHAGPYDVVYADEGAPVDTAGEKLIPSRRWEAWREGVEDYEYLVRLQRAVEAVGSQDRAAARRARRVLGQQVEYVLSGPGDPARVYEARERIVAEILELEGQR